LLDYFGPDKHADQLRELIIQEFDQPIPADVDKAIVKTIAGQMDGHVLKRTKPELSTRRTTPYYVWAAAIAALLIMVVGFSIYSGIWTSSPPAPVAQQTEDIEPGGYRAKLIMEGSNDMYLSETQEGIVADGNALHYEDGTPIQVVGEVSYATLQTPPAGQYRLTLPDGTKVWLNAASSLKYPTRFDGNERRVTLTGEAYFEVVRNTSQPFVVETQSQSVKVLGTSFNITSYADEKATLTTLVSGSIALQPALSDRQVVLKPDEQARLENGQINVQKVRTETFTAWKDGLIVLKQADIPTVIRQLQRWYDVTFVGAEAIRASGGTLSGELPRDVRLSEILRALEKHTGATFNIEGRRVMVEN